MTPQELSSYNGKDGNPAYVAYKGKVYDVSDSDMWKGGEHQGEHSAGVDLTEAMKHAPHGESVFEGFKVVGELESETKESTASIKEQDENKSDNKTPLKERLRDWYQVYHPHPVTAHFPIALHFFAAGMDIAFLLNPLEKFEQGTYYSFLFATIFGLIAIAAGVFSWWVNYNFSMIKPLVIKLYTAIFTTLIGAVALFMHALDPSIAYNSDLSALFYHFSIFITVPSVVILGFYGGKLTWDKKSASTVSSTSDEKSTPDNDESSNKKDFTILIGGPAGLGINTIENLLVDAFNSTGYKVFSTKEYMSRVRGGSNTVQIRISDSDVKSAKWVPDLFFALDEDSLSHVKERIGTDTVVVGGKSGGFNNHLKISILEEAKEHVQKQLANTFSAGMLFQFLGLPLKELENALKKQFKDEYHKDNIEAISKGYEFAESQSLELKNVPKTSKNDKKARYIDGTTASGFGFLAGGCNSVTSYPMSPSTGVLTFLAGMSKKFDVAVEQAEDEIAAFNMVLGVWYAGGRGLTTTSGGGFALMSEGLSLSGVSETPAVVYLAQRPGPATGLPTRTEQGDLNLALYSGHGEFPRLILAPGDPLEAIKLGHLAFEMADKFQVPVIYLSDQYLADTIQPVSDVDFTKFSQDRYISKSKSDYKRYKLTDSGISERSVPGYGDGLVCCDSHEHDERGQVTESYKMRDDMVQKRKNKLEKLRESALEPEVIGSGDIAIVGWGSTKGVISEVLSILDDPKLTQVHFSWIYPQNKKNLSKLFEMDYIIVVENNSDAQFSNLLKLNDIKVNATILQSDGFSFFSDKLVKKISKMVKELS